MISLRSVRSALLSAAVVGLLQCSSACSSRTAASPSDAAGSEGPSCEEIAAVEATEAYENAKPVFDTFCSACHSTKGSMTNANALAHFAMDVYPFGGNHSAEITGAVRKVLGQTGSPPSMPRDRPGAVRGDDLVAVMVWAEAYEIAGARGCAKAPVRRTAPSEEHQTEHGGGCH